MKNIEVGTFNAVFFVETKWGPGLEFVMRASEDSYHNKHGKPRHKRAYSGGPGSASYGQLLWDMLNKEFAKSKRVSVPDYCEYGHLSFTVQAGSPAELQKALVRCDKVVGRWINKYRINHMRSA